MLRHYQWTPVAHRIPWNVSRMGHPSSPEAIMPGTPSYLLTEIRMRRAEEEITWIIKNCTGTVLTRSDLSPWGVFIFGVAVSTITANRDSWIEWVLQGTSFCYKHTAGKLEGQELGLKTPVLVKKTTMEIIAQNTAQLSLSNPLNGNHGNVPNWERNVSECGLPYISIL